MHAALLARAGRLDEALELLRLTARIDLDDLGQTTAGGLHLAAMGSLWQALAFGFAGLRPADGALVVDPIPVPGLDALELRLRFRGSRVRVRVTPDGATVSAEPPITVRAPGTEAVEVGPRRPGRRPVTELRGGDLRCTACLPPSTRPPAPASVVDTARSVAGLLRQRGHRPPRARGRPRARPYGGARGRHRPARDRRPADRRDRRRGAGARRRRRRPRRPRGAHGGPRPAGRTALDVITRVNKPVVVVPPDGTGRRGSRACSMPLEGNHESSRAVAETIARAGHRDLEILVLHVHGPDTVPAFEDQPHHAIPAWAHEFAARFVEVPHADVEVIQRVGVAADQVVAVADDVEADLIALGWSQDLAPGRARSRPRGPRAQRRPRAARPRSMRRPARPPKT